MKQISQILLPKRGLFPLDYIIPEKIMIAYGKITPGDLVIVPYRNSNAVGIVLSTNIQTKIPIEKIKEIIDIFPGNIKISNPLLKLIKFTAKYYVSSLGSVAKLALPIDLLKLEKLDKIDKDNSENFKSNIDALCDLPPLSKEQKAAYQQIEASKKPAILWGVTGSGKTEIYFHLMQKYLAENKQVLLMLPEIGIAQQIIDRTKQRFHCEIAIWNSSITPSKKITAFKNITSGNTKIIIGTRSSLFLPYKSLGLIITDEEHDPSYKQESSPNYNARDMAVMLSKLSGAKLLMGSATPSIESIYNAREKKYDLIELTSRHAKIQMPKVHIVDIKKYAPEKDCWISPILKQQIHKSLDENKQILLFLNRRGYAPLVLCKECGYRFNCPSCSSSLVMHKSSDYLQCHHCSYILRKWRRCISCNNEDSLVLCGPGVERIEEEAKHLFPKAKIAVLSKDSNLTSKKNINLIKDIENNKINIIIGTQMISKGYHFAHLNLVGVIDADIGLGTGDLRAAERAFQMLRQVSGRAGRASTQGIVMMQSLYPEHLLFKSLTNDCGHEFIEYEIKSRERCNMPPFSRIASIIISSKNEKDTMNFAKYMVSKAPQTDAKITILGPSQAIMAKIANNYRFRILLIAPKNFAIQDFILTWQKNIAAKSRKFQTKIDIDPQSFY